MLGSNSSPHSSPPAVSRTSFLETLLGNVYLQMFMSGVRCMSAHAHSVREYGLCARVLCVCAHACLEAEECLAVGGFMQVAIYV